MTWARMPMKRVTFKPIGKFWQVVNSGSICKVLKLVTRLRSCLPRRQKKTAKQLYLKICLSIDLTRKGEKCQ